MVTNEMMAEMIDGKRPSFVFLQGGQVQRWSQNNRDGILVAATREAADVFAQKLTTNKGESVLVCEVGTVKEGTLARLISTEFPSRNGAGIYATDDGKNVYYFQPPGRGAGD